MPLKLTHAACLLLGARLSEGGRPGCPQPGRGQLLRGPPQHGARPRDGTGWAGLMLPGVPRPWLGKLEVVALLLLKCTCKRRLRGARPVFGLGWATK